MRALSTRVAALGAAAVVTVALSPQAWADPDEPVIPSREEVESAEQRVVEAERSVEDIQAELLAADDRLEQLGIDAQVAAERYNGALLAWEQARQDLRDARIRASRTADRAAAIRDELAGFVLAEHTSTSELTDFSTALGEGPEQLLDQYAEYSTSSGALDSRYQEWKASSDLARVYAVEAADAMDTARDAKAEAHDARGDAEAAVRIQEDAVVSIGIQRDQLLQELADAQDISLDLATQRQEGLEQRREERLAEQRRQELLEQQRQERQEQRRLERERALERQEQLAEDRADQRRAERADQRRAERADERRSDRADEWRADQAEQRRADRAEQRRAERAEQRRDERAEQRRDERAEQRREERQNDPAPPPVDPSPPQQSGSAQDAIDFAYQQLGEPYVWGAAGPDSWDCSGLTMGAWQAAGVSLPHYSVAQYYATTPVTYGDLRPGDLIFWGTSSSDPDTIFHVGMYIGGGQMIHAPRTGKDVEIQDVWYWESPDFFGRP
jgi:cell wall-associated NlpC family hydrolase